MIYKYYSNNRFYVYDMPTNNILEVDKIVYDILDSFVKQNIKDKGNIPLLQDIEEKYQKKYEINNLRKAYNEIIDSRNKFGLFSFEKPKELKMDIDYSDLETRLQQLILNVSERCNMRCTYCVYSGKFKYERTHGDKLMSIEVARSAIEYFLNRTIKSKLISISFYGGEPLLNLPVIKESVYFAKLLYKKIGLNAELMFSLTTNGTLLNDMSIIEFLKENNFSLLISLDGPKKVHDKQRMFRSGLGTYDIILNNLKNIYKTNPDYYSKKIAFSSVMLPENVSEVLSYYKNNEYIKTSRRPNIAFTNFKNSAILDKNEIILQKTIFKRKFKDLRNKYKNMLIEEKVESPLFKAISAILNSYWFAIYYRNMKIMCDSLKPNGICIPGLRRIFVSVSGNYYVCEKMGESYKIGNVFNGLDLAAINGLIKQYIDISKEDCLNCWAIRFCGACYVPARRGDILDRKIKQMSFCEGQRKILKSILKDYCEVIEKNPIQAQKYFGSMKLS